MPVREKATNGPGSRASRPFSRPRPYATPAKPRAFPPTAREFTAERDSPLEEDGFEPPVPLLRRFCRAANPDAGMTTGALKVRSKRRPLPGAPSHSYSSSKWDREFESCSLQRGVSNEPRSHPDRDHVTQKRVELGS